MAPVALALILFSGAVDAVTALSSLIGAITVGGVVALVNLGSTRRREAATADSAEVEVDKLRDQLRKDVLADARSMLQDYRESILEERRRAAEALEAQATTQADLARVQTQLAAALEDASRERHALRNEISARDAKIALLERQVADLRSEVETLRAQLDAAQHGRRYGDGH